MPLRLRIVNVFLASFLFVYLIEHRFKLLNLNQYVEQLNKDYLTKKNPQTQVQLAPLFEKVKPARFGEKVSTFSSVPDQILAAILPCEGSL